MRAPVQRLGSCPNALKSVEYPEYMPLIMQLLEQNDWSPERFDVYRCLIAYQIIGSAAVVRFPLRETEG